MAHFTRVRETGMWTVSVLEPSEMEALDAAQFAAINGDAGGNWVPTSVIVIGGEGLTIAEGTPFSALGNVTLGNNVTSDEFIVWALEAHWGAATFLNTVTCLSNVALGNNSTSHTLNVSAIQTYSGIETHNGGEVHNGTETHGGTVTYGGAVNCLSNVVLGNNSTVDTLTVAAIQTYSGSETHNGGELHIGPFAKSTAWLPTSTATYSIYSPRFAQASGGSGTATFTLAFDGTIDGQGLEVMRYDGDSAYVTNFVVGVTDPTSFTLSPSSGQYMMALLVWNATSSKWILFRPRVA